MPYEDFELLIGTQTDTGYPATVVYSPAGEISTTISLDLTDYEIQDMLGALEERDTDELFLTEFGTFLFEELFVGDIGKLYYASLNIVRAQEKRLRIRLNIQAPELAALPWEYLYDPKDELFLATASDTALVRYVAMRVSHRVKATQISPPLRILVVISNPINLHQLNFEEEKALIGDALQEWVDQGRVEIQILEHAIISKINHAIRSFAPHVFHFVGHGLFQDDTAYVILEDEDEHAHPVDERTFRDFFTNANETRLVVLNACQTATRSSSQPLVGLAPRLLQRRLPAVVAMQYPFADDAALVFTREFYRCIALGYPLEAAVAEARRCIFMETDSGEVDWGVPVLFLRAKHGQLFEIAEQQSAQQTLDIPPPPKPAQPPSTDSFIGRTHELDFYTQMLNDANLAVIAGMAGVGKTMMGAALVQHHIDTSALNAKNIFWHSFHQGEDVYALIWQLAGFLAWNDQPDIWRMLQGAQQTQTRLPPAEVLIDYVFQSLKGHDYLLCLDDFHYLYDTVDDDTILQQFVERLYGVVQEGQLSLILISRVLPNFIYFRRNQFKPLQGMDMDDVEALLTTRQVALDDDLFDHLYATTQGNGQLLTMAIDTLHRIDDPEAFVTQLVHEESVERYLLHELDSSLDDVERDIQSALAVLGIPSSRDAIESLVSQKNLRRPLHVLCERFLLWRERYQATMLSYVVADAQRPNEDRYNHHAIIRSFYYELPSRRQRRELHLHAGEYYEYEEEDMLSAAKHYFEAREYQIAASLLVHRDNAVLMVNRGQKTPLLNLLTDLVQHELPLETKARAYLVLGRFSPYDDLSLATSFLQNALELLKKIPDSDITCEYQAEAYLYLADRLHRNSNYEDSIAYCKQGLNLLENQDLLIKGELLVAYSRALIAIGCLDEAHKYMEDSENYLHKNKTPLQ
ncbi:MAG: CHAT domain-containing protein [Chloroflexota bacterium]